MNTIQLDMEKYKSILKELGVLKTENKELKKRLQTSNNSDYAKCKNHDHDLKGSWEYRQCNRCGEYVAVG